MSRIRKGFIVTVFVVAAVGLSIGLAGDVIVQNGRLDVEGDLHVDGSAWIAGTLDVSSTVTADYLYADYDLEVGSDMYVSGSLDATYGSFSNVDVSGDLNVGGDVVGDPGADGFTANSHLLSWSDTWIGGTLYCGKIYGAWFDPKWVQFDSQKRVDVVEAVAKVAAPEQQGGAVLFFNADTRRLEVYVAADGRFYDLAGNVVASLPSVVPPSTQYEDRYYLDNLTGEVKSWKTPICDRYAVKKGYQLDAKTEQFVNTATGQVAAKEEAIEVRKVGLQ